MADRRHGGPFAQEIDREQGRVIHQDQVGRTAVGGQLPGRDRASASASPGLAVQDDRPGVDLAGRGIVLRELKVLGQNIGAPLGVDQGGGVGCEHRSEFAVILRRKVVVHPMLVLASDHIDEATLFIRHHVDDALFLVRHPEVFDRPGARIVGQDVTTGILRLVFLVLCGGISLLGADVHFPGGTHEITGVKLRLRRVAGVAEPEVAVGIDDDALPLCSRIEFNEVGIVAVFGGADMHSSVVRFRERKVARLFAMRAGKDVPGPGLHIGKRWPWPCPVFRQPEFLLARRGEMRTLRGCSPALIS